jgi:hypothetical protein
LVLFVLWTRRQFLDRSGASAEDSLDSINSE